MTPVTALYCISELTETPFLLVLLPHKCTSPQNFKTVLLHYKVAQSNIQSMSHNSAEAH